MHAEAAAERTKDRAFDGLATTLIRCPCRRRTRSPKPSAGLRRPKQRERAKRLHNAGDDSSDPLVTFDKLRAQFSHAGAISLGLQFKFSYRGALVIGAEFDSDKAE